MANGQNAYKYTQETILVHYNIFYPQEGNQYGRWHVMGLMDFLKKDVNLKSVFPYYIYFVYILKHCL